MKEKLKISICLESALKTKFSSFKKKNPIDLEYEYLLKFNSLIIRFCTLLKSWSHELYSYKTFSIQTN